MKKPYVKPQVTLVKLNPAQAVLSICSTTGTRAKNTGNGTRCRSRHCKKKDRNGDSMGQS